MKKKLNVLVALAAAFTASCSGPGPDTACRLTAPLDDSAWGESVWISAADAPVVEGRIAGKNWRSADGSSWFWSEITNEGRVASARWMTTGLGVYELYVNGTLVGDEILKPGFTHYSKTKRSFTYDITSLLNKKKGGENALSVQSVPGWWGDKITTPGGHEGMIGRKCAFRGVLEIEYTDGTVKLYGTDTESWRAGIAGPVKHAGIYDGEEYDARELPGYLCPEKLGTPEVNREFPGEILPSDGAEVYLRRDLTLKPVRAYIWQGTEGETDDAYGKVIIVDEFEPGEEIILHPGQTLVVDFGQNCAAVPSFTFKAAGGTQLTCLPSELLNDGNGSKERGMDGPEGSCHRRNLRLDEDGMILKYTFADTPDFVSFHPECTFFGYRLVSVTADADVVIKSIESIPVTSIAQDLETGFLTTGDESINRLISNTVWGQRSNYLSVPTDCPQRNERLGWTADTQVFTGTGTFFANTDRFFHKWLRDLRDTQGELGGYPGVAPHWSPGATMRLGWSDAGIIVPWTVWKQFGDVSVIDESWESMEKFMNHIEETKYDHRALSAENDNYQWADWLSYEPLESCGMGAFSSDGSPLPDAIEYWNYLTASYWAIDAGMMCDMAEATGRDASGYEAMVREAKDYIRENFFNGNGEFKTPVLNTMQTPALFALRNGVLEGEAKANAVSKLRKNFEDHGNCLQTGFLGTSILMQTLTENGMSDIAWELLFQRKNPSWLYSVDNGATTIWERWNSYTIENGMGPSGMNSFNHYAYGCVCQWIWETVCGIASDTAAPGFRHIIMKPLPDRRLGFARAEYKSAAGLIRSEWRYDGDTWLWDFTIPEGATASVTVPGGDKAEEYPAGTYHIEHKL